ncbi:MAG: nucleoside kinase [Prevotellaceae bacterium]|nr:nucleoside kinase [Prevotellaceae bacterium]
MRRYPKRLTSIMGVRTLSDFNLRVKEGRAAQLINVAEALQERGIVLIADAIARRKARLALIAGPSSSGKTTFSKRLAIQLLCRGIRPHTLSTDDYFVNRVDTPRDETGEYDFECIGAVDTQLLSLQLKELLEGKTVELPRYDFPSGERRYEGKQLELQPKDVVIIEGNHALNPLLTESVPERAKYKVFVSPLSTLSSGERERVRPEDIRLLRRILRDSQFRGFTAQQTIRRNASVLRGERRWILPFKHNADAAFNSSLLYELSVLRDRVLPLLRDVREGTPEKEKAQRLEELLEAQASLPADQVPPTSLLREFWGGSSFKY